jgi:Rod binding domain-containing protein
MTTILPPDGQLEAAATPTQLAKARKAATDFEAMAIGQFLAPMFDTVDMTDNPFSGGAAEQTWRPMLTQELAKHIAAAGGLGLARPILNEMLRMQEAHQ